MVGSATAQGKGDPATLFVASARIAPTCRITLVTGSGQTHTPGLLWSPGGLAATALV